LPEKPLSKNKGTRIMHTMFIVNIIFTKHFLSSEAKLGHFYKHIINTELKTSVFLEVLLGLLVTKNQ